MRDAWCVNANERPAPVGRLHAPRTTHHAPRTTHHVFTTTFLRFTFHALRFTLPSCSKPSKSSSTPPPRSSRISGGFFDVPSVRARLSALEIQTGAANFWDNNEQARKVLDEQSA